MCACIAGAATAHAAAASAAPLLSTALPAPLGSEAEPNEGPAQASPIMGDQRIRASLAAGGDVDYYAFEARAGDRVFANLVTAADTRLTLLGGPGQTTIEEDDNDGSQFGAASNIAGAIVPADGTYYLKVEDVRGAAAPPASYDLYLALRSGTPKAEVETEKDEYTEANPLVNGEVTGKYDEAGDKDWFAVKLQAGDTVFLSLDLNPDRSGESFDGELGFGLAGDVRPPLPPTILTVDNASEPSEIAPSEAETMTVSQSGTYYGYVDVDKDKAEAGGETDTYDLAVTVFPAAQPNCRSYPLPFGSVLRDGGTATFPIQVDDPAIIARAALRLTLEEDVMRDLNVSLRSPAGTELPVFSEIGWSLSDDPKSQQKQLEATFGDFAAVPSQYFAVRPLGLRPKTPLAGFNGQQAQGTWNLIVKDVNQNGSTGNLPPEATKLVLCPEPVSEPPLPPGGGGGQSQGRPSPPPAAQPPVLSDLAVAPGKFRAAKAGPMVRAKRPKVGGALVSYQSSDAVQTNFVLYELEEGHRVGRKCVRPSALNSTKKPCVRRVKVISFLRNGVAGRNRFGFTGRVGARKLPPGEYQLQARAYSASGLTSAPVGATFTVLPPAAREAVAQRR